MQCAYCGYTMTPENETAAIRLAADGWHVQLVHAWCLPNVSNREPANPDDNGPLAHAAQRARQRRFLAEGRRLLAARDRIATDAITGGYADLLEVGDAY